MDQRYSDKLMNHQLKMTAQRRAIIELLEHSKGAHPTAEEIYERVRCSMPGIGIATVYRNLEVLTRVDILQKCSFEEGRARYEMCDHEREHYHHHFVCKRCGAIVEIEEDSLQEIEKELEKKGFRIIDHTLKLYGYCPGCSP